jgi:hypothetical protein
MYRFPSQSTSISTSMSAKMHRARELAFARLSRTQARAVEAGGEHRPKVIVLNMD